MTCGGFSEIKEAGAEEQLILDGVKTSAEEQLGASFQDWYVTLHTSHHTLRSKSCCECFVYTLGHCTLSRPKLSRESSI